MNISNLLLNITNNVQQKNITQINNVNGDNNSFLNILSMMTKDGSLNNNKSVINSNVYDGNVTNMILGGNINDNKSIIDTSSSNLDVMNLVQEDNQEDKSTNPTEFDYSNAMSMIFGTTQNIIYPDIQNVNFETTIINLTQSIEQSTKLESLIGNEIFEGNVKKTQELSKYKVPMNNVIEEVKESKSQNNDLNQISKIIQNENKSKIINSNENTSKIINLKASTFKETLVTEVNKGKDKLNTDIDSNGILVESKNQIVTNNNKIIEVSDESSKIKTTVLSQIEDKIVVMSKEKEGIQQVIMELYPKNLGKVNIKMSIEAEKMTVEIMALDEKTGSVLMSNAQELTKALQGNLSSTTVHVTVVEDSLNQYNQSGLNYSQQQSARDQKSGSQIFNNSAEDFDEDNETTEITNLRNVKLNKVV